MVSAELDFVVLGREREGNSHDTGVVNENVEAGGFRLKCVCGLSNGRERSQVEREICYLGTRDFFFDIVNGSFGLGLGSCSKKDVRWVVFGELNDTLFA